MNTDSTSHSSDELTAPLPNDPPSHRFRVWSRGNIGEVFPDPISPLNATAGFLHMLEPGWRLAMEETRTILPEDWEPDVPHIPIACFGGYLFLNLSVSRLAGFRFGLTPEAIDQQFNGGSADTPSYASEARPSDVNPAATAAAFEWLIGEVLPTSDLARFDAQRAAVEAIVQSRPDLGKATDTELLDRIIGFDDLFLKLWQSHILATNVSVIGLDGCSTAATSAGRPELALALTSGLGAVDSAGASIDMWPLSRTIRDSDHLTKLFDSAKASIWSTLTSDDHLESRAFTRDVETFLAVWGFRGPNEFELRSATWGTSPDILMAALSSMRHAIDVNSPQAGAERQAGERQRSIDLVSEALADKPADLGQFLSFLHIAQMFIRARERARMTVGMLLHEQRVAILELGMRAHARGHSPCGELIFMLTRDELCSYVAGNHSAFVDTEERQDRYLAIFDRVPPFVFVGQPPPVSQWLYRSDAASLPKLTVGETLNGIGGSSGSITGVVRIVTDPTDPWGLEAGEILVAPITDPAWTPLFIAAGGVVCEVGAPASHAAIVSRELGIPCVVSVPGACSRLTDGMLVELDGAAGTVRRLA